AESFVEKYEQPMYYCWSQRGIWPGFKGNGKASLGLLIPRFQASFVLGYISNRAPCSEDGQRRAGTP
ncbi:hypothetical protein KUCAC02_022875, partial [Chaenocephalus aceratus]